MLNVTGDVLDPLAQIDVRAALQDAQEASICLKKSILPNVLDFNWLAFYSTKAFKEDKWAIHYYAPIQGHELACRRDLIPSEPDHPRAGNWYYALQLGPLEHKLPPIVSHRWRRVTFIVTTGDRFMNAHEINDLFEQESPIGQLFVRLKELGIAVEREWWIDEEGIAYVVDLALAVENGWLPVTFGDRPGPDGGLHFATEAKPDACLQEIVQAGHLGPKAGKGFYEC